MNLRLFTLFRTHRMSSSHSLLLCDIDALAVLIEHHKAILQREERIVSPPLDVDTWMNLGTALSYENRSRGHVLACVTFNAKSLGLTISAVLCGTATLFMCHRYSPVAVSLELFNRKNGMVLPVSDLLLVAFSALFLEGNNLVSLVMLHCRADNFRAFDLGCADL